MLAGPPWPWPHGEAVGAGRWSGETRARPFLPLSFLPLLFQLFVDSISNLKRSCRGYKECLNFLRFTGCLHFIRSFCLSVNQLIHLHTRMHFFLNHLRVSGRHHVLLFTPACFSVFPKNKDIHSLT